MALLSRKTDYALLILSYLHQHPEGGTARAIAEQFNLSRAFVANILKELCQRDFVISTRGVKGGYVLQRSTSAVTLAELLEVIEEGFKLTLCNAHGTTGTNCEVEHVCTVKAPMNEIHRRIMELLRSITLADVFAPIHGTPLQPALGILGRLTQQESPASPV